MENTNRRIAKLEIALPGWKAVYQDGSSIAVHTLEGWAVLEKPDVSGDRSTRMGLLIVDGNIVFADAFRENGGFLGYARPGEDLRAWERLASAPERG